MPQHCMTVTVTVAKGNLILFIWQYTHSLFFLQVLTFKFLEKPTICVSLSGINNWIINNRAFVAASILLSIFSEVSRHWTQDVAKNWLLANFTV